MTTPNDNSYILAELRDLRQAQQKTQVEIVHKLATIEANLANHADIRARVEALEKVDARRAGVLAAIAAVAGSVAAIVVAVVGAWARSALHIG
ncbi:hypothetical protein [Neorhizobium tomejilense]|uniref:hypothetical protein n=1 Tax=Neorhizobium tomejilense TaxID=2093828 RepID=UPI003ED01BCE